MAVKFANKAKTTLAAGITAAATSLTVASAAGLPALGAGDHAYMTISNAGQTVFEIVRLTAISGTTLTVTRAQEGTAATAFAMGDPVELRLTTAGLIDALAERLGVSATAVAATILANARTITVGGSQFTPSGASFNGSANITLTPTLADASVNNNMLAGFSAAGFKGAVAAGNVSDLTPAQAITILGLGNVENKSSATIRGELTGANVTTALGFTPATAGHNHDGTYISVSGGVIGGNLNVTGTLSQAGNQVWDAGNFSPNLKANLASPAFTGTPTGPTAGAGTNTAQLATTSYVVTAISTKANLASPLFTGMPAAPTAAAGTSTTQIATTAFVASAISTKADLASPGLTGTPTAPTASVGTATSQLATTAFVSNAIGASGNEIDRIFAQGF